MYDTVYSFLVMQVSHLDFLVLARTKYTRYCSRFSVLMRMSVMLGVYLLKYVRMVLVRERYVCATHILIYFNSQINLSIFAKRHGKFNNTKIVSLYAYEVLVDF